MLSDTCIYIYMLYATHINQKTQLQNSKGAYSESICIIFQRQIPDEGPLPPLFPDCTVNIGFLITVVLKINVIQIMIVVKGNTHQI